MAKQAKEKRFLKIHLRNKLLIISVLFTLSCSLFDNSDITNNNITNKKKVHEKFIYINKYIPFSVKDTVVLNENGDLLIRTNYYTLMASKVNLDSVPIYEVHSVVTENLDYSLYSNISLVSKFYFSKIKELSYFRVDGYSIILPEYASSLFNYSNEELLLFDGPIRSFNTFINENNFDEKKIELNNYLLINGRSPIVVELTPVLKNKSKEELKSLESQLNNLKQIFERKNVNIELQPSKFKMSELTGVGIVIFEKKAKKKAFKIQNLTW